MKGQKVLFKLGILSFVGVCAFLAGSIELSATDLNLQPKVVKSGNYAELNWYRQIKLGLAPYVNPNLSQTYAVVYEYTPDQVVSTSEQIELVKGVFDGSVALAKVKNGKGLDIVSWADLPQEDFPSLIVSNGKVEGTLAQEAFTEFLGAMGAQNYTFVSTKKQLDGIESSSQLVSWQAGNYSAPLSIQAVQPNE